MNFERITEDLTTELDLNEETNIVQKISEKYDELENSRQSQLEEIKEIRDSIYLSNQQKANGWNSKINLPDIYELAQTLKSHITENIYSHPDAMFDVEGANPQSQAFANRQKAMLVNTFEKMKVEDELEHVIDGIIESGECTLFIGWETKIKTICRVS